MSLWPKNYVNLIHSYFILITVQYTRLILLELYTILSLYSVLITYIWKC